MSAAGHYEMCCGSKTTQHAPSCIYRMLDGCTCHLTKLELSRGEPHATECALNKPVAAVTSTAPVAIPNA